MDNADFHIEFARYADHLPDLRAVREPVFIVEQAVPAELEWDEQDPLSVHVIARDKDNNPIGTARLTPEHGIGRMAVLAPWRGRGVGSALLEALIEHARSKPCPFLELHAQTHAISFYERFGFTAFGPEYDEAGIPHRSMRLVFSNSNKPDDDALQHAGTHHELATLTLSIIQQARNDLVIYSRDLDPPLLGSRDSLDALRSFAIGSRAAHARILVHDLRRAIQEGHGVIALAQRLPSKFSIRVVEEEPDVQYAAAFVLNDRPGYVFRPNASRPDASACMHGPARQRQLLGYFNEVWERARPASELRPL